MYCPNCGANNSTEQSFCRSCGLNLEKTAESLLEQIPSAENAKLLKQQRDLEKFGNIAFGGFGVVLLTVISAIIYWIVTKTIMTGEGVFGGILLVAFIIFSFLSLTYVVLNEVLKNKKQKNRPNLENELPQKLDTAKLLEQKPFEPIPSVTEETTNLLFIKREKKISGELN